MSHKVDGSKNKSGRSTINETVFNKNVDKTGSPLSMIAYQYKSFELPPFAAAGAA